MQHLTVWGLVGATVLLEMLVDQMSFAAGNPLYSDIESGGNSRIKRGIKIGPVHDNEYDQPWRKGGRRCKAAECTIVELNFRPEKILIRPRSTTTTKRPELPVSDEDEDSVTGRIRLLALIGTTNNTNP